MLALLQHCCVARRLACALAVGLGLLVAGAPVEAKRFGRDYFPNVPGQNQHGETLNFYDDLIKGRMVVISFIYTTCRDICPLITARLAQVQERLADVVGRDIHFISVSIDPENDTVAKLREHAEAFRAGPGWQFITGKREHIDMIRYKLGERSRALGEHQADIVLGNDIVGDWSRDSAFSDLNVLAMTIRNLDPKLRAAAAVTPKPVPAAIAETAILPGEALFARACAACHTVGKGRRVGPDLVGITERRERAWLLKYIASPRDMRAKKDPIALELHKTYKGVMMPSLGLSETDAADALGYIEFLTYRHKTPEDPAHAAMHAAHGSHAGQGAHSLPKGKSAKPHVH